MFGIYELENKDSKLGEAHFLWSTTYASEMVDFILARKKENPDKEYIMILDS